MLGNQAKAGKGAAEPAASRVPSSTGSMVTMDQHGASSEIFISISGMIGAGKTTLANALGEKLNLPVYHEPVADNAYLADFYKDKLRYGFPLQVYLLNRRFQQHQQIIWTGKGGVQDRTIYEDTVFAKVLMEEGNMEPREYETYRSLFSNMSNFMKKPNLIVHLDVSPEESLRRIEMRSRGCESGIPIEYLQRLHAAYDDFLKSISRIIPVIRVDYSKFRGADEMADMVIEEYKTMSSIRHVDFGDAVPPPKTTPAKDSELEVPEVSTAVSQKEPVVVSAE